MEMFFFIFLFNLFTLNMMSIVVNLCLTVRLSNSEWWSSAWIKKNCSPSDIYQRDNAAHVKKHFCFVQNRLNQSVSVSNHVWENKRSWCLFTIPSQNLLVINNGLLNKACSRNLSNSFFSSVLYELMRKKISFLTFTMKNKAKWID